MKVSPLVPQHGTAISYPSHVSPRGSILKNSPYNPRTHRPSVPGRAVRFDHGGEVVYRPSLPPRYSEISYSMDQKTATQRPSNVPMRVLAAPALTQTPILSPDLPLGPPSHSIPSSSVHSSPPAPSNPSISTRIPSRQSMSTPNFQHMEDVKPPDISDRQASKFLTSLSDAVAGLSNSAKNRLKGTYHRVAEERQKSELERKIAHRALSLHHSSQGHRPPYESLGQKHWDSKVNEKLIQVEDHLKETHDAHAPRDDERALAISPIPHDHSRAEVQVVGMYHQPLYEDENRGFDHPYCVDHCATCLPMETKQHPGEIIRYRSSPESGWERVTNLDAPKMGRRCECGKPELCDCKTCRHLILTSLDPRHDFRYEEDKWENNKLVQSFGSGYLHLSEGLSKVIATVGKVPIHRKRKREKHLMYQVYKDQILKTPPANYIGEHGHCKAVELGLRPKGYECLACANCTPCC